MIRRGLSSAALPAAARCRMTTIVHRNVMETEMPTSKATPARSAGSDESASALIDARIEELGDWRGAMLARLRALIKQAVPDVTEEWKWRGTPVWSHNGLICTGETYKHVVKMTFARGAALPDPARLFNASLEGNVRRAIDIHEGDTLDEPALKALIRAAADLNSKGRNTVRG
jgi:hypothetical protein